MWPHDPARAKGVGFMITRTSQPASGAMLISEMKEFAGFPKATQRYIRRSLDVAYGRRDALECWARDEGEAASIRAQARLYKQLDHLRLQVPDDSGLDMIEPFIGMLITVSAFDLGQDRLLNFAAYRFLYERLIGAASRPWLPAAFCSAAALPHPHPAPPPILPPAPRRRSRTFTRIAAGSCFSRSARARRPRPAGRAASRCSGRSGSKRSTRPLRPELAAFGRFHRREDLRQLPEAVFGIFVMHEDHPFRLVKRPVLLAIVDQ